MTNRKLTYNEICRAIKHYSEAAAENLRDFIADCDIAGGFATFAANGAVTLDMERFETDGIPEYMLYHRDGGNLDPAVTFAYDENAGKVYVYTYESETTGAYVEIRDDEHGADRLETELGLTEFLYNWTEGLHKYGYRFTPWKAVRK